MTVCTSCGTTAPDEMRHCNNCGARLPEPEVEAPGNTSHFGDQDIKSMMARMEREGAADPGEGNLLAGLPRPKVGSMLSPLRGGQTSPTARKPEKRARSASGSTVMGMPLFTTGEQRAMPAPRPRPSSRDAHIEPAPPAGAAPSGGPSIQSLDSFQDDFGAPIESNVADTPDSAATDAAVREPSQAPADPAAAPTTPSAPPAAESASIDEPRADAPPANDVDEPPPVDDAPELPGPEALDITSPQRPTEQAPAVGLGGNNTAIVIIVIAAVIAGVAFFLLK